ncbi:MAG: septum formation protein Maf [Lachnospiraceae bacterium]|nr:septum formation protein Maf [Lachnospiraceae bacterium]
MKKIVLASASARRRDILEQCGISFEVKVSDVDENIESSGPDDLVTKLSYLKAKDVFDKTEGPVIVIGSDTVVSFDGKIYGKPKDAEDAVNMLKTFSGGINTVYSGVAVIVRDEDGTTCFENFSVATKVFFRDITEKQIRAYVATGEPMDKAGAYAIQGRFAPYIEKVEGDYYNIVGLPICAVVEALERLGENVL